ncbi:MAG: adenylyltransferase/cytidyltransferase family protein [bacterium]|nr:adenylyltransferase/cytidyltransferase family protein [bacterium]
MQVDRYGDAQDKIEPSHMSNASTPPRCDRLIFGGSFDPPHRGHLAILRYALCANLAPVIDLVPAAVSPFKTDAPPTSGEDRRRLLEAALLDLAEGLDLLDSGEGDPGTADESRSAAGAIDRNHLADEPVDLSRVHLRTLELERPPPSYTADTCATLRKKYPGQRIGLLIGSDSLHDFERWTRVEEILAEHPVYVFRREGESLEDMEQMIAHLLKKISKPIPEPFAAPMTAGPDNRPGFVALDNPLFPCSSTNVRGILTRHRSTKHNSAGDDSDCLSPRVAQIIAERGLYSG